MTEPQLPSSGQQPTSSTPAQNTATTITETPGPTPANDSRVDGALTDPSDNELEHDPIETLPTTRNPIRVVLNSHDSAARVLEFPSSETNNSNEELFVTPGQQSRNAPVLEQNNNGTGSRNQPVQMSNVQRPEETLATRGTLIQHPTQRSSFPLNIGNRPTTTRTLQQQEEWLTEQVLHQQRVSQTLVEQISALSQELQFTRAQNHNRIVGSPRQPETRYRQGEDPHRQIRNREASHRVTFEGNPNIRATRQERHPEEEIYNSPERESVRNALSGHRRRRELSHSPERSHSQRTGHSMRDLRRELDEMRTLVHQATSSAPEIDQLLAETERNPFTYNITSARVPLNDKLRLPTYDGTGDPSFFIRAFLVKVGRADFRQGEEDEGKCQLFLESLRGDAQAWFTSLPSDSISCFEELRHAFFQQYMQNLEQPVSVPDLYAVKQGPKESLRDFIKRFKAIYSRIRITDDLAIGALSRATWFQSRFWDELTTRRPRTMNEAFHRANIHIKVEEERAELTKTLAGSKPSQSKNDEKSEPRRYEKDLPKKEKSRAEIALAILSNPKRKANTYIRDPDAPTLPWCDYHRKPCHKTEDCRNLRDKLMAVYQDSRVTDKDQKAKEPAGREPQETLTRTEEEEVLPPPPNSQRRQINMIMGGLINCGDSVRSIQQSILKLAVDQIPRSVTLQKELTFTSEDLKGLDIPHNDPLVIELQIGDCDVQRILIDTGSSVDVISLDTLKKMEIKDQKIKAHVKHLTAFGGETVSTIGTIKLPVSAGGVTKIVKFDVVEKATIYNAIFGTPWLFSMEAVPSTYHQCLKFPTPQGFFTIRGDQRMARRCFVTENKLRQTAQLSKDEVALLAAASEGNRPTSADILSELLKKSICSERNPNKRQRK